MGVLSGTKNESVVFGQRERIGGEFVQRRVFETQRRLHLAPLLLLAENVGDVVGAERACGMRLGKRGRYGFRSVFTNQERAVRGPAATASGRYRRDVADKILRRDRAADQALLFAERCAAAHLREEFLLKTLRAESLSALPAAGITDDLLMLVVDGDRGSVGFDGELVAHITRRHAVAVAVEGEPEIFVDQRFGGIAVIGSMAGRARRDSG